MLLCALPCAGGFLLLINLTLIWPGVCWIKNPPALLIFGDILCDAKQTNSLTQQHQAANENLLRSPLSKGSSRVSEKCIFLDYQNCGQKIPSKHIAVPNIFIIVAKMISDCI